MNGAVDAGLLEEVKQILRRDLKLGPDANIPDDMPLVGGEMDLDSLDILLIVSSVEKHFGIKIPNEVVGQWVFQNVSTLAKYIRDNRQTLSVSNPTVARSVERNWLELLPHGPEFRFVTTVGEVVAGERASGIWNVDGSEWYLKGHFPGRPVVPGVLITEGLAQVAGLAASDGQAGKGGMLAHVDVKFESPVVPPASIELRGTVSRTLGQLKLCDVVASVSGQVVARGSIAVRFE